MSDGVRRGLVMEGGAMRGMFTCGILDVLMDNDITFDGAVAYLIECIEYLRITG